jgi:hypothetical protein
MTLQTIRHILPRLFWLTLLVVSFVLWALLLVNPSWLRAGILFAGVAAVVAAFGLATELLDETLDQRQAELLEVDQ